LKFEDIGTCNNGGVVLWGFSINLLLLTEAADFVPEITVAIPVNRDTKPQR